MSINPTLPISQVAGSIDKVADLNRCPIGEAAFAIRCQQELDEHGVLGLPDFLTTQAIAKIISAGVEHKPAAYYIASAHNVHLKPADPELPNDHPRNRKVSLSRGFITTYQIPTDSLLRVLYDNDD